MVFSTLHDQEETERVSPLCTRSLLSKVVAIARAQFHLQFTIGAEIEFCLFRNIKTNNTRTNNSEDNTNNSNDVPVDKSLFAQFVSLAEQSDFVNYTIAMLEQLNIDIEQIHAESAHGQFEIVLCHLNDPIMLADHIVMTREVKYIHRYSGLATLCRIMFLLPCFYLNFVCPANSSSTLGRP